MDIEPRAVLAVVMLLGAMWSDLRVRRVCNVYWVPFVVAAAVLWAGDLATGTATWSAALGALAATAFLYAAWWTGVFGGADAKGLMTFAWTWPGTPDLLAGRTIPVFDTLVNGTVLVLVLPVGLLLWNGLRGRFVFPAMMLGVETGLETARRRHVWPMQRIHDGRLRWRFWQRPSTPLEHTYGDLTAAGVTRVWVTPKVPFMVPLAAGSLLAWTEGNLLLRLML